MRHRWVWVTPKIALCRNCGMERHGVNSYRFEFPDAAGRRVVVWALHANRCQRKWFRNWKPTWAHEVRPDLFPTAAGRDGPESPGHDAPARPVADSQVSG